MAVHVTVMPEMALLQSASGSFLRNVSQYTTYEAKFISSGAAVAGVPSLMFHPAATWIGRYPISMSWLFVSVVKNFLLYDASRRTHAIPLSLPSSRSATFHFSVHQSSVFVVICVKLFVVSAEHVERSSQVVQTLSCSSLPVYLNVAVSQPLQSPVPSLAPVSI